MGAGALITHVLGHDMVPEDTGDTFDQAADILSYAEDRLRAAALGEPLPEPPRIRADLVAARVFYCVAVVSTLGMAAVAWAVSRRSPQAFARLLGFNRIEARWAWQAFLLTVVAYGSVYLYGEAARAIGVDILIPEGQTPRSAIRDDTAFLLFGALAVIAAPIGEETLFRGLVFGGLLRWGFWPAALISGFVFALSHVDPGTYIPFTAIGVLFAWFFRRNNSLWPSIICHAYFNGVSFLALALMR